MSNWTDELKQQAIDIYTSEIEKYDEAEQAKFSMEIVKTISEELEQPVNGVRIILTKANVYVKSSAAKPKPSAGAAKGTSTRVNKAEAIQALKNQILAINGNDEAGLDNDILDKLTGKAAVYFAGVLQNVVTGD